MSILSEIHGSLCFLLIVLPCGLPVQPKLCHVLSDTSAGLGQAGGGSSGMLTCGEGILLGHCWALGGSSQYTQKVGWLPGEIA